MIYVMSDIHGRKDRFEDVLEQINLQENDVLYILGDVIDRNPSGVSLLRYIQTPQQTQISLPVLVTHHLYMMKITGKT